MEPILPPLRLFARLVLTGALALLPLIATLYLAFWLLALIEHFFAYPIIWMVGESRYRTGTGLALGILVFFGTGLAMRTPPFRWLFHRAEEMLMSVPLVKSIYGATRDFVSLFGTRKGQEMLQVVEIRIPGTEMRLMGFVTRTEFDDVPDEVGGDRDVAVYLPMSYQVGGYTIFMPRRQVTPIDMPREEAMRFVLMAGVKASRRTGVAPPPPPAPKPNP